MTRRWNITKTGSPAVSRTGLRWIRRLPTVRALPRRSRIWSARSPFRKTKSICCSGATPVLFPAARCLRNSTIRQIFPAGLPSALLERRPDVKGAEDLLVAANANIGAAKALFFPNFSLTSTLGSATRDLSNLADRRAAVWSVAGGVLQPVFQGWRIFYNYEASKFRFEQAVAEYQRAAQNGFREVADALVTIEKLKDVRAELETSVQALANAARLSRLRYDTGLANYLEILIADQQLFDQELLLARTRGAQLNGVVQLYRALGGGWQP